MKTMTTIATLLVALNSACGQAANSDRIPTPEKMVGGSCEGCEAIFEYGSKSLGAVDTLPDFHEPGRKLEISGTIYQRDGITPAKDVILYIYHTDQNGRYPRNGDEKGWAVRHGYIRGWIKTNADGRYKFYTLKPGPYPEGGNPAHIHPTIKEPGVKEYWIDEYLFEEDPFLTDDVRKSQQGRGGMGILKTKTDKTGMILAERDIVLGLNVPGYD